MRSNIAYLSGGAIHFGAVPSSTLLVERSILESNDVQVQQSGEKDTPSTVVIFTGGVGDGSQARMSSV